MKRLALLFILMLFIFTGCNNDITSVTTKTNDVTTTKEAITTTEGIVTTTKDEITTTLENITTTKEDITTTKEKVFLVSFDSDDRGCCCVTGLIAFL